MWSSSVSKIIKNLNLFQDCLYNFLNKRFSFKTAGSPKEVCGLSHVGYLLGEELIFYYLSEPWLLSRPVKGAKTKTQLRNEKRPGADLNTILTKDDFSRHILSFMVLGTLFNLYLNYAAKNEKPRWQNRKPEI